VAVEKLLEVFAIAGGGGEKRLRRRGDNSVKSATRMAERTKELVG